MTILYIHERIIAQLAGTAPPNALSSASRNVLSEIDVDITNRFWYSLHTSVDQPMMRL